MSLGAAALGLELSMQLWILSSYADAQQLVGGALKTWDGKSHF